MHLVLSEPGLALGKTSERIVVRREGKTLTEVPVFELQSVMIASQGVSLSTDALELCTEHGVPITFSRMTGECYAKVISAKAFGDAALRMRQLCAREEPLGVRLAKAFVDGKLRNQIATLKYFAKSRRAAGSPSCAVLDDACAAIAAALSGLAAVESSCCAEARVPIVALEARAAHRYWDALRRILPESLGFAGRERRGADDPTNLVLNYGYGILYGCVWSHLIAAGLDPYAGFLHVDRVNEPTLVYDFIEEFRQSVVDRPVLGWLIKGGKPERAEQGLSWETRRRVAEMVLERLNSRQLYEGKQQRITDIIRAEAYELASHLRGDVCHNAWISPW